MTALEKLLAALAKRREDGTAGKAFGYGITTADRYMKRLASCAGDEACSTLIESQGIKGNWQGLVKDAEQKLVYSAPGMEFEDKTTNSSDFKSVLKDKSIEIPQKTIMVVRNIVTTPHPDRDGDILRSEGAKIDPKMPFLWMHFHPAVAGKMLEVVDQNKKLVRVTNAIMDTPLGSDVADMIEFGAVRISHGFMPLEVEELDERKSEHTMWTGWDIKQFEIMENSAVSVPSNVEAVFEMFSRDKFADPFVKGWAAGLYEKRKKFVKAGVTIKDGKVFVPKGANVKLESVDESLVVEFDESSPPEDLRDEKTGCTCKDGEQTPPAEEPTEEKGGFEPIAESEILPVEDAKLAAGVLGAAIDEIVGTLDSIDKEAAEQLKSAVVSIHTVKELLGKLKGRETVIEVPKKQDIKELLGEAIVRIGEADVDMLKNFSEYVATQSNEAQVKYDNEQFESFIESISR